MNEWEEAEKKAVECFDIIAKQKASYVSRIYSLERLIKIIQRKLNDLKKELDDSIPDEYRE